MASDPHLAYWRDAFTAALDEAGCCLSSITDEGIDRAAQCLMTSVENHSMAFHTPDTTPPRRDHGAEVRERDRIAALEADARAMKDVLDRYALEHNVDRHRLHVDSRGVIREMP